MTSSFFVKSPNVNYSKEYIDSLYNYNTTKIEKINGQLTVHPLVKNFLFRTNRKIPKFGLLLVGWGGNNGTTITAAILANKNKLAWNTKNGLKKANYFGSITQSATIHLGTSSTEGEVYVPLKDMVPMVNPNDIVVGGWDISSMNMADAMVRAKVMDYNLQAQLRPMMEALKPKASVYVPDFIAANQADRADNVLPGSKREQLDRIRLDIHDFKESNGLEEVLVLWTANTERYSLVTEGINTTADLLLKSIDANESEISPSTIYAVASILEGCTYINGSPQNTFVPGVIELAERKGVYIAGDDLKTGQTKLKSVLVDFLVSAGIKPLSIVSYNHLGNNDGKNLSAPSQFKSKEISKSNVVDDIVRSNQILYGPDEKPDHCVVIKYVPQLGDSKRAMDEYTSEIMLDGHNTIVIHNTCEDSLLAVSVILDLVILAELLQRVHLKALPEGVDTLAAAISAVPSEAYEKFHPVMSALSYLLKAPLVPNGAPIINALFKQKACIENLLRAFISLPPENHMLLEYKLVGGSTATHEFYAESLGTLEKRISGKHAQNVVQHHKSATNDPISNIDIHPKKSSAKVPPTKVPSTSKNVKKESATLVR